MKYSKNLMVFIIMTCFISSSFKVMAQEKIEKPIFIGTDGTPISIQKLCITDRQPDRGAIAKAGMFFTAGTEFVLELSDGDGVFSDPPRVLSRFTTPIDILLEGDIEFPLFSIPIDLGGENYSLRVSVPADNIIGTVQENIVIYFFDTPNSVVVNKIDSNVLCDGGSIGLQAIPNDLPKYIWYFNANPDSDNIDNADIIPGESGPILDNITEEGLYFVRIDFGSCTSSFAFNSGSSIRVFDFDTTEIKIKGPALQEFCPSAPRMLEVNIDDPNFIYKWFKDGVLIPDEDSYILSLPQSNFGGMYTVEVIGSDVCSITTEPVEVVNLGSDILTQPPPLIMLLPTQPILTLSITTNAPSIGSTIEWFRMVGAGRVPITAKLPITDPGALSIDVSDPGVYFAEVFANDFCGDILTATTEVFEPVGFRTEISTLLDCDDNTGILSLENLFGITATGLEVPITIQQYPFFDFEWFLDVQSTGITETTLSVNQDNIGEIYALEATLTGTSFDTARSNELIVEFLSEVVEITPSMSFLPPGSTITLSAPQSTSYIYEWFIIIDGENQIVVNGDNIVSGQGTNSIEINTTGEYFVRITLSDCVIDSRPMIISNERGTSEIIPNIVTPNGDGINDNWLLPSSLFNQQDVEVIIYNLKGQVDFTSKNYQNNWPSENSSSLGQNPIYYFMITKNKTVVRKGSITVMR
ncbi:gliding motility-associated C-terminal domain-containing protein [Aquimarina sp. AU119]|uniref:T9SS type B sorting domain-containing protein n=1 Tax=Aquimarina sp. AU119 TaxID=2108528 RepID=UPI000D68BF48|nr:gliding motility-associated C-terminal domain-containing protein [Aquimarina sp. AU119]